ncbi:conserved hypothetical protein [Caldicellulosiruptor hydrothermalis 108]|uniref:DUF4130 domain-containing protein n=1 Tax=Caldicellulosiruptor hydrothermalis (strain DSM 18901 / VKM B-2411 / 108) TaxID=632292 RepID=E4Q776_CALH1|nr:TIGR03915 family putative DNA repair protein [Caldicellulosiruptor hydrothermalis]ADQ06589.1 conserved hypothetical protein [Caldicellulosiruptor hydrothermalis 108]
MYKIFLYDGTFEGFMCAAFHIISEGIDKDRAIIVSKNEYQPMFIDSVREVQNDFKTFLEMRKGIIEKADSSVFKKIYYAFLSDTKDKEGYILRYLFFVFEHGKKIKYLYSDDIVNAVEKMAKNVSREIGKYMGLMRFCETDKGFLYAKFEPKNDIIKPIAYFFKNRLNEFYWAIHDVKRNKVAIYDRKKVQFLTCDNLKLKVTHQDEMFQMLWKNYFKAVAIEERKNLKLQQQNMPKRYWKYLLEKN